MSWDEDISCWEEGLLKGFTTDWNAGKESKWKLLGMFATRVSHLLDEDRIHESLLIWDHQNPFAYHNRMRSYVHFFAGFGLAMVVSSFTSVVFGVSVVGVIVLTLEIGDILRLKRVTLKNFVDLGSWILGGLAGSSLLG